ncbi:protein of unknown function [Methylocella tundrae]|uniref:Uncharacterized protein n=1 Tax=Methylocella tundrae TaxID=227605 RepID=A0A4U8Z6I6_METTU|nr:protein of unknown function [Methylocella tundrae]
MSLELSSLSRFPIDRMTAFTLAVAAPDMMRNLMRSFHAVVALSPASRSCAKPFAQGADKSDNNGGGAVAAERQGVAGSRPAGRSDHRISSSVAALRRPSGKISNKGRA